jgi:hypothetical protein
MDEQIARSAMVCLALDVEAWMKANMRLRTGAWHRSPTTLVPMAWF